MDHNNFPYRASGHLALLHVINESGGWQRQNLDVNYTFKISSTDAHRQVPTSDIEFVGGNHVSTYGRRARGDTWTYLGQTINRVDHRLVVRADSGIDGVSGLKGKKVLTAGSHPALNDWLYLKQNGLDVDKDQVEIVNRSVIPKGEMDEVGGDDARPKNRWELVKDGTVDATFLTPPKSDFAAKAGLKAGDIVEGDWGWQDYAAVSARRLVRRTTQAPLEMLIGPLSVTGLTAYFFSFLLYA